MAVLVPGRNAKAQGLSNVATGVMLNELVELLVVWAVVELELPQAVTSSKTATCMTRMIIGDYSTPVT
jgi:hypothetical protein